MRTFASIWRINFALHLPKNVNNDNSCILTSLLLLLFAERIKQFGLLAYLRSEKEAILSATRIGIPPPE